MALNFQQLIEDINSGAAAGSAKNSAAVIALRLIRANAEGGGVDFNAFFNPTGTPTGSEFSSLVGRIETEIAGL